MVLLAGRGPCFGPAGRPGVRGGGLERLVVGGGRRDRGPARRRGHLAAVLLTIALVVMCAILTAAAAGVLAHLDGATSPRSLSRAVVTFAAVLTLAEAITTALTAL
ncbi:hypothetical protein [Streptomyces sp. NRRL S-448]|uniref:hypothetical protein n=1 Tax=Streptomyces sp. NRRL S-448 TaxID=1463907 RepID=UPI00356A875D